MGIWEGLSGEVVLEQCAGSSVGASHAVTWVRSHPRNTGVRDEGQEGRDGELTQGGTLGQTQPHDKAWLILWGIYRDADQNHCVSE